MIRRLLSIWRDYGRSTYWVPYSSRSLWATAAMPLTTAMPEGEGWIDASLWERKACEVISAPGPIENSVAAAIANETDGCLLESVLGEPCAKRSGSLDQYALLKAKYGKPARWCWPCWHRRNEDDLQAALLAVSELYANNRRWNG